jgi:hypothetical protein
MMTDTVFALAVLAVLALPWSLKQAGLLDKTKQWYKILLSGILIGLLAAVFSISSSAALISAETASHVVLAAETTALILATIGVLGVIKNLVTN